MDRDPYAYDDEFDSDDENGEPKQSKPLRVEVQFYPSFQAWLDVVAKEDIP